MRSPKDMEIIEIDITNACIHSCSNCTRFCGHHKKNYFMDFETFKKAVDSLGDYKGMIGVMGGEPTLHPEFERISKYLQEKRLKKNLKLARGPIEDMQFHIDTISERGKSKGVLLSTLSKGYYKNFEIINDVYDYQILNDHSSNSEHQALLMSRKELGVSDEEWIKKRDACWIQNAWSASITPKGAFFCEVAGALDMLFDGPGGWPIEEGWYNRTPEQFGKQLEWCELCSACLDAPKRLSHDERDDVTPDLMDKLIAIGSPKALDNKCVVRNPKNFDEYKSETYKTGSEYIQAGGLIRTTSENRTLYPQKLKIYSVEEFKRVETFDDIKDWVLVYDDKIDKALEEFVNNRIWNLGCFYEIDSSYYLFNVNASSIRDLNYKGIELQDIQDKYADDKYVYVNREDELLFLLGGETKYQKKRFNRLGRKLIIFGAGSVSKLVIERLIGKDYKDFSIAVSDVSKESTNSIMGYQIHDIRDFSCKKNELVVLIATRSAVKEEIRLYLEKLGFCYCDLV